MIIFKLVCYFLTIHCNFITAAVALTIKESQGSMKRECIVSNENYETVLRSPCFVDKTLMIKEFMSMNEPVILLTAPRRFGKSVNLKMLNTFLTNKDTKSGSCCSFFKWLYRLFRMESSLTPGCKLFKDNNLNIYKLHNSKFFYLHCGQYPVIFISFKSVTGSSFSSVLAKFRGALNLAFLEHKYLLNSDVLDNDEKELISQYTGRITYRKLSEEDISDGLKFLSEMLYKHFNRKVIVLINEFDAPVWQVLDVEYPKGDVRKTIKFIRSSVSTLFKGNEYLDRAFINACVRMSRVLSLDANNIIPFHFLGKHPLDTYYGLTSKEVKTMLSKFNISKHYYDVKDYYYGYKTASSIKIYSTWSIMNYMQYEDLTDYWVDTAGLDDLIELFQEGKVRELITQVIETESITIQTVQDKSYNDIIILKDIMAKNATFKLSEAERFIQFLFDNGYFVSKTTDSKEVCLRIPNEEIHQYLFKAINHKLYFENYFKFDTIQINEFLKALNLLGLDENKTESLIIFRNSVINLFRNNPMPESESSFQGYLCTLIKSSKRFLLTKMEVYGLLRKNPIEGDVYLSPKMGNGETNTEHKIVAKIRADILTVRNRDGAGIIIETKRNWKSAEAALYQIVNITAPYYKLFHSDDYSNNVRQGRIYIGLHLNTIQRIVTACYLVSDTDMNSKICV